MSSILRYIGTKDLDLIKELKDKYLIYCEPFGGSFSTGINLVNAGFNGKLIYNDLDESVVNFWRAIKTDSQKVYKLCEIYNDILNELESDELRSEMLQNLLKEKNEFKRAAAEYLYRTHLTMKGISWLRDKLYNDEYDFCIEEYNMHNVEILNSDYKKVIKDADSEKTFMLIDPPYEIPKVNNYYRGNCKRFNHDELAKLIKTLKCGWLLTYNKNQHILKLYKDYNIFEVNRSFMGITYTELYITNTEIEFTNKKHSNSINGFK